MTAPGQNTRSPIIVAEASDRRFPVFSPEVLDELAEFGEERDLRSGRGPLSRRRLETGLLRPPRRGDRSLSRRRIAAARRRLRGGRSVRRRTRPVDRAAHLPGRSFHTPGTGLGHSAGIVPSLDGDEAHHFGCHLRSPDSPEGDAPNHVSRRNDSNHRFTLLTRGLGSAYLRRPKPPGLQLDRPRRSGRRRRASRKQGPACR